MSGIICAIRGGPHSQGTITRAIDLARETGLELYFLYIVNLEFLSHTSSSRIHTILEEMRQMGEFILLSAQATAATRQIDAQCITRHGRVREEMIQLCREIDADYLVLGQPRMERDDTHFTLHMLETFIERTEQETGAKIVIAGED